MAVSAVRAAVASGGALIRGIWPPGVDGRDSVRVAWTEPHRQDLPCLRFPSLGRQRTGCLTDVTVSSVGSSRIEMADVFFKKKLKQEHCQFI